VKREERISQRFVKEETSGEKEGERKRNPNRTLESLIEHKKKSRDTTAIAVIDGSSIVSLISLLGYFLSRMTVSFRAKLR